VIKVFGFALTFAIRIEYTKACVVELVKVNILTGEYIIEIKRNSQAST
jgi:hypothetical protein